MYIQECAKAQNRIEFELITLARIIYSFIHICCQAESGVSPLSQRLGNIDKQRIVSHSLSRHGAENGTEFAQWFSLFLYSFTQNIGEY